MLEIPRRKSNPLLINCCILVFVSMQYAVPWDLHQGLAFIHDLDYKTLTEELQGTPGPSVPSPRCVRDPAPQLGHRRGLCLCPGTPSLPQQSSASPSISPRAKLCLVARHHR